MRSILIKDTTREERIRIVHEALWGACGIDCEFCSGCDDRGGGRTESIYQPYIDGLKEIRQINAEFSAAKAVTPYRISVRPARVTSWATMRWTPGPTGMVINRYRSGDKLTVLKELKHYLQVQDPLTGDVGDMEKAYAVRDSMD